MRALQLFLRWSGLIEELFELHLREKSARTDVERGREDNPDEGDSTGEEGADRVRRASLTSGLHFTPIPGVGVGELSSSCSTGKWSF